MALYISVLGKRRWGEPKILKGVALFFLPWHDEEFFISVGQEEGGQASFNFDAKS